MLTKSLLFLSLFATVLATEFIFPKNGELFVIDTMTNLTWDPSVVGYRKEVELVFKVPTAISAVLRNTTDMTTYQRGNCISVPSGQLDIDLTIPVQDMQDSLDNLDLPFDVDVRWFVDTILSEIDRIPEGNRNVTIQLYRCGENEPVFQSWVLVSGATRTVVALGTLLLLVLMLV
ncbi:hypothetical protein J8273_5992 [Carpediemonas membranifera]|uniref:Uncharacterized protein n=1 Tax=Carpediemonas membranifera TaxID=201153 RepID=A0A8J6E903_9EUKA|nr:hypothetical protein J8273_5992 [Carpediemonas membranifera]|eukprot:KAG9392635.1 hypothetical protein J8273_5992 [Carpediemonas membranifera]